MGEKIYEDQTFVLTGKQFKKFVDWKNEKGYIDAGAVGGAYTVCFTPTSLGDIVSVKCIDGTKIDLTDYDSF